jgi:c-di-GMP-binding flagellar brake protein YcgR
MTERRRWSRLPLAIPVFVRARTEGKEFLEFATALNVSAGGMLVAVRHVLSPDEEISVEIPSAALGTPCGLPKAVRTLRARVQRTGHVEAYNLVGLKFARPLIESLLRVRAGTPRRRQASVV